MILAFRVSPSATNFAAPIPTGRLAGHVLGAVNVDNKGVAGIEKYIDDVVGVEAVHGAELSDAAPVRLSIDIGVQHALEDELDTAMRRYQTEGAAGLVLDVKTGEVIARLLCRASTPPSRLPLPTHATTTGFPAAATNSAPCSRP